MENMEGDTAPEAGTEVEGPIKVEIILKQENTASPQLSLRSSTRAKKSLSKTDAAAGATDEEQTEEVTQQAIASNAMAEAVENAISELVGSDIGAETPAEVEEPATSTTTTTVILTEAEPAWNQNNCIICNSDLDEFTAELKKTSPETKEKLLKFFCEYMNVKETMEMANDNIVPFCPPCAADIDKLQSLACKIEFMDSQFERLRDTVARKTVKTYLYRNKPELLDEKAEHVPDMADEHVDTSEQLRFAHPADMIFNSWKRKYDMILPGRFKKFPVLAKSIDARQRVSYFRIDTAGKHHLITSIGPGEEREEVSETRVKRTKSASTLLANNPQIVIKRVRMEDSLAGSMHGDDTMDVEYADTSVAKHAAFPYECGECPRSYATKSLLKYHARVHSGEKPFKCHHCSKAFAQRGGLATHLLVHSGEKPFVCEECGKHFRQKYHLTQHKFIHSGVKPFQCDVCNKKFNVKMNLKEHMRRHTGDRPYRCEYCDTAGFFRKKKLRDHMVKSHPNIELPAELLILGNDKNDNETNGDMAVEFIHESDEENKLEDDEEESHLEGTAPQIELVHDKASGIVRPSVRIVRAT